MATIDIKFTQLPVATALDDTDITAFVQNLSTVPVSRQVSNLLFSQYILGKTVLTYAGNPNGFVAGTVYQLCWDSVDNIMYVCVTTGTAGTAVWARQDNTFSYAGNPNSNLAGQTFDTCLDTVNGIIYYCTTTGTASTAVWTAYSTTSAQWINVTSATQTIAVNKGYIANNAAGVTFLLPSSAMVGSEFAIQGSEAGGWSVTQNINQLLHIGNAISSTGIGGSIASTNRYDSIRFVCIVQDLEWACIGGPQGNITLV